MSKNIYRKLLEVRKAIPYLPKDEQGPQYKYVSSSTILSIVREKMDEVGLMLIPKVLDAKVNISSVDNREKDGNIKRTHTFLTELQLEFQWVDVETGESISIPFYSQGYDVQGEKGVGKALTYAEKYFLLKQFNIPTGELDPDAFQEKTFNANAAIKFISKEQVNELTKYLKEVAELRSTTVDNYLIALKINNIEKVTVEQYPEILRTVKSWLSAAKKDKELAEKHKKKAEEKQKETEKKQAEATKEPSEKQETETVKPNEDEPNKKQEVQNKEGQKEEQHAKKQHAKKMKFTGEIITFEIKMRKFSRNGKEEEIPYGQIGFRTTDGKIIGIIAFGQEKIDLLDQADGTIDVFVKPGPKDTTYFFLESIQGAAA